MPRVPNWALILGLIVLCGLAVVIWRLLPRPESPAFKETAPNAQVTHLTPAEKKLAEQVQAVQKEVEKGPDGAAKAKQDAASTEAVAKQQLREHLNSADAQLPKISLSADEKQRAADCLKLGRSALDVRATEAEGTQFGEDIKNCNGDAAASRDRAAKKAEEAQKAYAATQAEIREALADPQSDPAKVSALQAKADEQRKEQEEEEKKAAFWNTVIKVLAVAAIVVGIVLIATGAGAQLGGTLIALGLSILFSEPQGSGKVTTNSTEQKAGAPADVPRPKLEKGQAQDPVKVAESDEKMRTRGYEPIPAEGGNSPYRLYANEKDLLLVDTRSPGTPKLQVARDRVRDAFCPDQPDVFTAKADFGKVTAINAEDPATATVELIERDTKTNWRYTLVFQDFTRVTAKSAAEVTGKQPAWCSTAATPSPSAPSQP